jgi:VWFA-related protein
MPTRFPFLLALLFITAFTALAQDDDVIRTNTENVVLNITVTDKSGQYVKGLKGSDFKVYEDGVEVKPEMIASFSLQESPYAAVVLLDSSGSMEARFTLARSAAIRFLDGLREEDVAAVYRFD